MIRRVLAVAVFLLCVTGTASADPTGNGTPASSPILCKKARCP